jgi:hypothetical protein
LTSLIENVGTIKVWVRSPKYVQQQRWMPQACNLLGAASVTDVGDRPNEGPNVMYPFSINRDIDWSDHWKSLQTLLAEAEAIVNSCRAIATRVQEQAEAAALDGDKDSLFAGSQVTGLNAGKAIEPTAVTKPRRKYRRHQYGSIDVGLLQLYRLRVSQLGIGPLMVLNALLKNCGRLVNAFEITQAVGPESRLLVKAHVSRIRQVFRENNIDVSILTAAGGYGLPRGVERKILSGLKFSPEEIEYSMKIFDDNATE